MQQISVCRAGLDVFPLASCTAPLQFAQSIVQPAGEFADSVGSVPAFQKGVVVGGLRFRYAYSVNTGTWTHTSNIQDYLTIHSALLVLPLAVNSGPLQPPAGNVLSPVGVLFINRTVQYQAGGIGGLSDYRCLWRGLDKLRIQTQAVNTDGGELIARMQSTAEASPPSLQRVKAKVRLPNNMGLFFVTEIADGFTTQTGDAVPWNIALDIYGVAAVKPIQRGFGA